MSFIFPPNPVPGDITVGANGATWAWDGVKWVGGMGGPYVPEAGGTMTGPLFLFANPTLPMEATTKDYVDFIGSRGIGEANFDGQAYGRELGMWTPVVPITGAIMRGSINSNNWQINGVPIPLLPHQAANKEYVDNAVSGLQAYMGIWQVAANNPDISITAGLVNGAYFLAATADPTIPEVAPAGIPGIGGQLISNGSMILWDDTLGIYQSLRGDQLTRTEADTLYLQLIGGTLTGQLFLVGAPIAPLEATTKQYVDDAIAAGGGGPGGGIPEAPATGLVYGRDGFNNSWIPVLTTVAVIDGGTF
jgi:hypothetical protein